MEKKFGRVWQPVGALKIPTFAKEKPLGATATVKARWPPAKAAPKHQEEGSFPKGWGGGGGGETR